MNPKFKAHPWHGISVGEKAPEIVNVFVGDRTFGYY